MEIEQLLDKKRNLLYHQGASSPNSNASPLIAGVLQTMEDNQPRNELLARIFCIIKFRDIVNKLNRQLYE